MMPSSLPYVLLLMRILFVTSAGDACLGPRGSNNLRPNECDWVGVQESLHLRHRKLFHGPLDASDQIHQNMQNKIAESLPDVPDSVRAEIPAKPATPFGLTKDVPNIPPDERGIEVPATLMTSSIPKLRSKFPGPVVPPLPSEESFPDPPSSPLLLFDPPSPPASPSAPAAPSVPSPAMSSPIVPALDETSPLLDLQSQLPISTNSLTTPALVQSTTTPSTPLPILDPPSPPASPSAPAAPSAPSPDMSSPIVPALDEISPVPDLLSQQSTPDDPSKTANSLTAPVLTQSTTTPSTILLLSDPPSPPAAPNAPSPGLSTSSSSTLDETSPSLTMPSIPALLSIPAIPIIASIPKLRSKFPGPDAPPLPSEESFPDLQSSPLLLFDPPSPPADPNTPAVPLPPSSADLSTLASAPATPALLQLVQSDLLHVPADKAVFDLIMQ